jgi:hypothetical protein
VLSRSAGAWSPAKATSTCTPFPRERCVPQHVRPVHYLSCRPVYCIVRYDRCESAHMTCRRQTVAAVTHVRSNAAPGRGNWPHPGRCTAPDANSATVSNPSFGCSACARGQYKSPRCHRNARYVTSETRRTKRSPASRSSKCVVKTHKT